MMSAEPEKLVKDVWKTWILLVR